MLPVFLTSTLKIWLRSLLGLLLFAISLLTHQTAIAEVCPCVSIQLFLLYLSSPCILILLSHLHYYKKSFRRRFEIGLRGGQHFQPPRLMVGINRSGHFLITEAVARNRLAKSINRGGHVKIPVMVNND